MAPSLSEPGRRSIAKWLAKHRVSVLEDDVVTEVRPDAVVFADGAVRPSAITIWTAGFGVPDLATASGLRTDGLGRLLANTVLSRIAGTAPAGIDQAFVGSCVSLGRHAATVQLARKDDTPVNYFIGGRLGASVKEAICKGTLWGLRREARKPGSTFVMKGGKRPSQPTLEEITES